MRQGNEQATHKHWVAVGQPEYVAPLVRNGDEIAGEQLEEGRSQDGVAVALVVVLAHRPYEAKHG